MAFDFVLWFMLKFFRRKEREKTFQAEDMGQGSEVCDRALIFRRRRAGMISYYFCMPSIPFFILGQSYPPLFQFVELGWAEHISLAPGVGT